MAPIAGINSTSRLNFSRIARSLASLTAAEQSEYKTHNLKEYKIEADG